MFQTSEKPLQKGKYTLAKEFSKGYLQEIKSIREHYGQGSNFIRPVSHVKSSTISFGKTGIDRFIENKDEYMSQKMTRLNSIHTSQIRFGSSKRQERFENLNLAQQTDFPSEYSQFNFLVENKNNIQTNQIAKKFYEDNFAPKNLDKSREKMGNNLFNPYQNIINQFNVNIKEKDKNKTTVTREGGEGETKSEKRKGQDNKSFPLCFPSERKAALLSEKLLHQNMAWEKANRGLIQKRFRICKSAYRSGILSVDDPTNQLSELYKNENELYKKKEERSKEESGKRREELRKMMKTNSEIEFGGSKRRREGEIKRIGSAEKKSVKNPKGKLFQGNANTTDRSENREENENNKIENLELEAKGREKIAKNRAESLNLNGKEGGEDQKGWKKKEGVRRVDETRRRVFGEEEGMREEIGGKRRRENIYWNEHKGRDWNIISWKKEELLNV